MLAESELAEWSRRHPMKVDALLTVALIAITVPGLWVEQPVQFSYRHADPLAVVLTVASCLPLVWRRRAPEAVFVAVFVPSVAIAALGYLGSSSGLTLLVALYAVAVYRSRRVSAWCLFASLVGSVVVLAAHPHEWSVPDYVATMAVFSAGWAFGRSLRLRRAYVKQLETQAVQLDAQRASDTRAALAEERGRIARELHDVVAHHVSVMTVQASAAQRTLARDPERAREAMVAVEQTGRAALVEMRRIVGVLRTEGETIGCAMAPQPRLSDLHSLVEQVRDAGLDVALEIKGAERSLDTGIDLAVFRVVQEALTNTLKHAGASRAGVTLFFAPGGVQVRVVDDGDGDGARRSASGAAPGHGLLGMRERVALYGGQLQAGPCLGGGFEVRAEFPLESVTA